MLEVRDVSLRFGTRSVLDHVSLSVGDGETVGLLGPSGIGKSSLLRIIAGLVRPDSGAVFVDGTDVTASAPHKRHIGIVFQNNALFPHLSVRENIEYGLRRQKMKRATRDIRVDELLAKMKIESIVNRSVDTLSGGEAKRVAVARTLAPRPTIVLLDEPLTGLDLDTYLAVRADLIDEVRSGGSSALWVTHDENEATAIATRVVRLGDQPTTETVIA